MAQNAPGSGLREPGFCEALTSGDFNNDGFADLAIGVPNESVGDPLILDAGAVNVIYGSSSGLDAGPDDFWHQDRAGIKDFQNTAGVLSAAEEGEFFGLGVVTNEYNGDIYTDLLITEGSPFAAANVLFGRASGLTAAGDQYFKFP